MNIDTTFDFTTDTPFFWDGFWDHRDGLGSSNNDPDAESPTMRRYHQLLWSRMLPNGETMDLAIGTGADYLTWKNFRFGSDAITTSFRYKRNRIMINQVIAALPDYKTYMEEYIRRAYTVGGIILFPKHRFSMNQDRGTNHLIRDRWDLTLECIRRYYEGMQSPLYETILRDKAFFDLFVDFRGYVDFFFLQDCVSANYTSVVRWIGDEWFSDHPLPRTPKEYFLWIEKQLAFVQRRNERIAAFASEPVASVR